MGAVNTDWIRPFLFDEAVIAFEFDYSSSNAGASAKSSVSALSSKQGLLLKLNLMHDQAFMFLDHHGKKIQMVQSGKKFFEILFRFYLILHLSVYISTIENAFGNPSTGSTNQTPANNLTPQFVRSKRTSTTSKQTSSLLDRSISLSGK